MATVYLVHFAESYKHARHYLGVAKNLDARIAEHLAGHGARLLQVVNDAGIAWQVVRTWKGDRKLERRLKNWKRAALLCPVCAGAKAEHRGNFTDNDKPRLSAKAARPSLGATTEEFAL